MDGSKSFEDCEAEAAMNSDAQIEEAAHAADYAQVVRDAIERIKADDKPSASMEEETIEALTVLQKQSPAVYADLRHELKKSHPGVLIGEVSKLINAKSTELFPSDGTGEQSLADELVTIVTESGELFHCSENDAYITMHEASHKTYLLQTKSFREWLSWKCRNATGKTPSESMLASVILALSGEAKHDGELHDVYLRAAPAPDGGYILDLCNDDWQVVHITAAGWRIVGKPPVRFRRTETMKPFPMPVPGGNCNVLWRFVPVPVEYRILLVAWIFECWRQRTPFPILEILGGEGCGKSSVQERSRQLIDPNAVNLRSTPKEIKSVHVTASANWLLSFNNLSHLSSAMQDALCCIATGGGHADRALFTDKDEVVIESMRPIAVNGITPFITAPDLIDRTVRLHLPGIPKSKRKKAEQLNSDFEKELPRIFGALLDLFVKTLAELPNVKLDELPRMADFAELGEALRIAVADSEPFVMTYEKTRRAAIENSLEASPAICALLEFLDTRLYKTYEGSVGNLLTEIEAYKKTSDAWPKSPKGFSDALNRYSTALREIDVSVEFNPIRQNDGRHVTVKKDISFSSPSVGIKNQPSLASQPSLFFGLSDACDASDCEIPIPTSRERKENVFSDVHSPDDDKVDFEQ